VGFEFDDIKEEEMVDYNMIEPKYEPIDPPLSIPDNQPFGLEAIDNGIKVEETLNDDMIQPKDEPIDEPPNDDQDFNMDLVGDEIQYKDEPLPEEYEV
ncbi:hypothetical protein PMAYCL1PPCAC_00808, partial [Pristionchus mayeri]